MQLKQSPVVKVAGKENQWKKTWTNGGVVWKWWRIQHFQHYSFGLYGQLKPKIFFLNEHSTHYSSSSIEDQVYLYGITRLNIKRKTIQIWEIKLDISFPWGYFMEHWRKNLDSGARVILYLSEKTKFAFFVILFRALINGKRIVFPSF